MALPAVVGLNRCHHLKTPHHRLSFASSRIGFGFRGGASDEQLAPPLLRHHSSSINDTTDDNDDDEMTTAAEESSTADFYADIRAADGSYKFLCNGEWRVSTSGATCGNVNPSKGNAPCYTFQACTQAEVDEAYATAKVAHKQWARTPLHKRADILHKAAALMRQHQGPMADALVVEIAKAAKDAKTARG